MTIALRYPAISLGGLIGASLRWLVSETIETGSFPWATFAVNVVGAALLAWASVSALTPTTGAAVGTGFCGGLTTFSTFSVELVELIDDDRAFIAVIYGIASVATAFLAFVIIQRIVEGAR